MDAELGISSARQALVWVGDHQGHHRGQGLLLDLDGEGLVVLTCHHVVAAVPPENLRVALQRSDGQLGDRMLVQYDAFRSHPSHDAAVLRIEGDIWRGARSRPLLHALDPARYDSYLQATALTYLSPNNFGARIGPSTWLQYPGQNIVWPDAPARYAPSAVFRLEHSSDTRSGISGGVVVCEGGVVGLSSAGRRAGAQYEREAYLIPIQLWAEGWPELEHLIEPLLGSALHLAAKIGRAEFLDVRLGGDIAVDNQRPDVYLEREVDQRAREILGQIGTVLIIGRPLSGKTRLAWELLRQWPRTTIVVPYNKVEPPPPLVTTAGLANEDLVLFIGNLHETAEQTDPLEWRRRLEAATGRPCLMICTSRDAPEWERVQRWQEPLLRQLGNVGLVYTSRVNDQGDDLSYDEGRLLAARLDLAEEELERFDGTPGSLTLDLQAMRLRYEGLRDQEQRLGMPMHAILDAAKVLSAASQHRLTETLLRKVTQEIVLETHLSRPQWDALKRRSQEVGFGRWEESPHWMLDAPTRVMAEEFRTYRPYLEQCVTFEPTAADFESLLRILTEAADDEGLYHLGSAFWPDNPVLSEEAFRRAMDAGSPFAAHDLGVVLIQHPERQSEAESALRQAAEAGTGLAFYNLGVLLSRQPGREAEAEAAYREATAAGHAGAAFNFGLHLEGQPGREAEAEAAYRQGADAGSTEAAINLGVLLARQPGREPEAETAFRQGADAGSAEAAINLGILLARQPGREEEAETAFRQAADTRKVEACVNLGLLLQQQPGREGEAETAFRQAADEGDIEAAHHLHVLLERQAEQERK